MGLLFTRFITRLAIVAAATGVVTELVEFADSPEYAYAFTAKAEILQMVLRHVARTVHGSFLYPLSIAACLAVVAPATSEGSEGANVRIATYQTSSGEGYFAASIQPSADDALLDASRSRPADIVVIVDTSASQSGQFRDDSIAAFEGVIGNLRSDDRVRVFAADVRATDLSKSFVPADQAGAVVTELKKRLPLGNTNLLSVIGAVRATLVSEPRDHSRSIVYIGDGASINATSNQDRFGALVSALRADRIAVHSIAVGPAINIELMGILANQTGGVVGVVGEAVENGASEIGTHVGDAATMSPIWLTDVKLFGGMSSVQANRLPPLRLDRDSIYVGRIADMESQGTLRLTGETTASSVQIVAEAVLEESHPDFSFLPGLVKQAKDNEGLMLPTAGSLLLRETARVLAERADALVRAGNMALQQGNRQGAKAVAEKALEADPDNTDAQMLEKVTGTGTGNRLIIQNAPDTLEDVFAGGASDEDAGAPVAAGDENPFAAPAAPAPASAAASASAAAPPAPAAVLVSDNLLPTPTVGDADLLEPGGGLLDRVRAERTASEGRLRAEVRAQLREANRRMQTDPTGVAGSLKSLLANVETIPDINPQLRQQLESQVRAAIQVASRREAVFREGQRTFEQRVQGATAAMRLLEETFRREDTLKTLSQQMNALIDEGRYEDADGEVTLEFAKTAGDTITKDSVSGRHFTDEPLMLQVYDRDRRYREMRERNFVDAFSLVLKSNIPFVDEPPIVYPASDVWQRMSRRRIERYGSIELVGDNETERRIQKALGDETSQSFVELPLSDAVLQISEAHDIPIVVDNRALEEIGLSAEEPVTLTLQNVSLRSFLRLMLRELDLTYMIQDEVMQITTAEAAEENLINKVYPVGDLVVPILQLGGGGGMGGGGGGMGGGMGGGGGGGMFAVPDGISLRDKKSGKASDEASQSEAPKTSKAAYNVAPIRLQVKEGQSRNDAWNEFFANVEINSAEELTILDQRIRATVGVLSAKARRTQEEGKSSEAVEHFAQARDALASAIRVGHVQPWMYQAYAISLKATGAPQQDVERALLSAVDFAETPEDVLHVAARLEGLGSEAVALELCRNVSEMDPYRREPYVMGLRISKSLDDLDGVMWACQGVLSQAWPQRFQAIVDDAKLVARATHARLVEEGLEEQAKEFETTLKKAASHDVVIRVSWTGDADLDLAIEEPSGTVCAIDNRSTAGGGTLLADAFPGSESDDHGTISETYICPHGFSGQYRLLVRRVWGNVSTGHATVEILTDVGRDSQRFIRKQVPLTEKDALVVFQVKDGQRQQEVAEAQLAHLQNVQRDIQGQFLGQFGGDPTSSDQILTDLLRDVQRRTGGGVGGRNPFIRRGAVGFRPELTVLPEGASMSGIAIISADRRYVRITPIPFFSQIGDVTTFNFVTGDTGNGGGGAGGGLPGGIGGGGGGQQGGLGN